MINDDISQNFRSHLVKAQSCFAVMGFEAKFREKTWWNYPGVLDCLRRTGGQTPKTTKQY